MRDGDFSPIFFFAAGVKGLNEQQWPGDKEITQGEFLAIVHRGGSILRLPAM